MATAHPSRPQGYHDDLPYNDPANAVLFVSFHQNVYTLLADTRLSEREKVVMLAYLIYGKDASNIIITGACRISLRELTMAQEYLRQCGWLEEGSEHHE